VHGRAWALHSVVSGNKLTSLPHGGRLLVWQPILPVFLCYMSPLRLITVWLLTLPFLFIMRTRDFSGSLRDSANELQPDTSGCRLVMSIQVRVKSANYTIDDRTQPLKDWMRSSSPSDSNSYSLRASCGFLQHFLLLINIKLEIHSGIEDAISRSGHRAGSFLSLRSCLGLCGLLTDQIP
jgi:hypothetical protein